MVSRKPVEIAPGVHWYCAGVMAGNNQMVASASAVVQLQPRVLAPGHGHPLSGEAAATGLRALRAHARPKHCKGSRPE